MPSGRSANHNLHPFHRKLHGGELTRGQVQAWALNRYYYQSQIPAKDATLLARLPTADLRREWRTRLVDHDGDAPGQGGIARWLRPRRGRRPRRGTMSPPPRACSPGTRFARRRLRALRARPLRARGGRLVADRAVLADHHRRARRRHAVALRLHHARDPRLFRTAADPGTQRREFRPRLRPRARNHTGAAGPGARRAALQVRACCGRSSMRCTSPTWHPP